MKEFPNGFSSWQETHCEISQMWALAYERETANPHIYEKIEDFIQSNGTGGMYEACESWTDEFELKNKDRVWEGEGDFFEEIEQFMTQKINELK